MLLVTILHYSIIKSGTVNKAYGMSSRYSIWKELFLFERRGKSQGGNTFEWHLGGRVELEKAKVGDGHSAQEGIAQKGTTA